jgi:hypothetical protein
MIRYIGGVEYRHPLAPTAYLTVNGRTELEAKTHAKKVGTHLTEALPPDAKVLPYRHMAFHEPNSTWICTVPVVLGELQDRVRPILSALVLRGSV